MLVDLIREVGTTLFAGGVVLVGIEYVDRRDGDERANRRLRKVVIEEAPANPGCCDPRLRLQR